jgi:hypothetical protein
MYTIGETEEKRKSIKKANEEPGEKKALQQCL